MQTNGSNEINQALSPEGKLERMDVDRAIDQNRTKTERREVTWRMVFFGFTRSRRRIHRRSADDDIVFLDWHHPWLFFLATGTMLLSTADAFLTLQLLDHGMYEVNPVMAAIMAQSTLLFTSTKLAMTGIGILTLVFLARSRFLNRFRTGVLLTVFFSFYAILVCYELVSLFKLL